MKQELATGSNTVLSTDHLQQNEPWNSTQLEETGVDER